MSEELHWASMAQLARALAAGRISSVEITGHLLARIRALDGRVQSFVHVAEDALAQARASDKRRHGGRARPYPASCFRRTPTRRAPSGCAPPVAC